MLFDTHIHTEVSGDSEEKLELIISCAKEKGMGFSITDHMDINDYQTELFVFDVDEYFEKYEPMRSDSVLIGIEMGLKIEAEERNKALAEKYDFDIIIGSLHAPYFRVDEYEYYHEPTYVGPTKEGDSKNEVYAGYLKYMLTAIERNDYFDTLAHIDYICRYARYEDKELYYDDFKESIDPVLKALAERDKAIEISTRRIDQAVAYVELLKILKAFKRVGGKYVTIGSDSHTAETLGFGFEKAMKMIEEAELTPVYFKNRKCIKMT